MSRSPRRKPKPLQHSLLQQLAGMRLLLRRPLPTDQSAIFCYASNPQVSHFMGWSTHHDEADTHAFLDTCIDDWQGSERLAWVIEHNGQVLGMIEAKLKGRNAGIGYVLAPDAWGQGYATETLELVSEALFRHSPVSAIWALCVTHNSASARVLDKCGYQREKLIPRYFVCPNIDSEKHDVWRYVRYRHPVSTTQNRVKPV